MDKNAQESPSKGLREFVEHYLWLMVGFILLLICVLFGISYFFEAQLFAFAQWVYETLGLFGIFTLAFLSDTLPSPFPPDALLVIISRSPLAPYWIPLILAFGGISVLAGCTGWVIGRALSHSPISDQVNRYLNSKSQSSVEKFGVWAVVVGGITPFPFSITCLSAGFLRLKFKLMVLAALLRIPRFFLMYLVIQITLP